MSIKVAIGDEFLTAFASIPRSKQKAVMNFVTRFRNNPRSPGINYETIHNAREKNFRSVRIDLEYRGIVLAPEQGNVYVLLWVDKHDDAYAWAARHRCSIHPQTGALQIFETELVPGEEAATAEPVTVPAAVPEQVDEPLFALDDKTLLSLGVPTERLALVQGLQSEQALVQLEGKLPVEAFEALILLAAGTSLDDVVRDYVLQPGQPVDTEDYAVALDNPWTQRRFRVPEDEQELGRMLNAPLERWRVFLHPTQRQLVERNWNGPVRVLGGAGTGKTVVAMHRARWLVSQPDWRKHERLLFTTFTSNLALDIEENLKKICTPEQMQRIEVVHLDRWVSQFVRRHGYQSRIVYPAGRDGIYERCWEQAAALIPLDLDVHREFYREEWQRVVLPQQIRSRQEYFRASRIGRGKALTRAMRAQIWPVFEEMREQLLRAGAVTAEDAVHFAREVLQRGEEFREYRALVVDEGQDFSGESYMLLRALVPEQANDIFIVGDAHQRIYQHKASLGQCGIRIVGRGRKLRINYRTTELIRRYAMGVLENQPIDDLDEGEDQPQDYCSLVQGLPPVVEHFADAAAEAAWLVEQIRGLTGQGVEAASICVVARTNRLCGQYEEALKQAGLKTWRLTRQHVDNRSQQGIRLATMHRVKGLEFHAVFIVAVNEGVVPLTAALTHTEDKVEQRMSELNERALFHVAATRAVHHLFVSGYGVKSSFLQT
ncbi:MAG: UvrD-helicase domain-containing protein [Thiopseudomonas sp.]